jgi:hypothetical protein
LIPVSRHNQYLKRAKYFSSYTTANKPLYNAPDNFRSGVNKPGAGFNEAFLCACLVFVNGTVLNMIVYGKFIPYPK